LISNLAASADREAVARTIPADNQNITVGPERATTSYQNRVAEGVGTDNASCIGHRSTIGNHHAVAATLSTDSEITAVGQYGSDTSHGQEVIEGGAQKTNVGVSVSVGPRGEVRCLVGRVASDIEILRQ